MARLNWKVDRNNRKVRPATQKTSIYECAGCKSKRGALEIEIEMDEQVGWKWRASYLARTV